MAIALNTLASGQADAMAMRMPEAFSMTRAATLKQGCELCGSHCRSLGDFLLDAPHQPVGRVVQNEAHLVGVGMRCNRWRAGHLHQPHDLT